MKFTLQQAATNALRSLNIAIEFNGCIRSTAAFEDDRDALADALEAEALSGIGARVKVYNDELNRLELAPNGDDYNALLDIIAGATLLPSSTGR